MRTIISIAALAVVLTLTACGPQYRTQTNYAPPPSESGRMCVNNCLLARQQCTQTCAMQQTNCEMRSRLEGQNEYLQYANERMRQGKEVKKSPGDFSFGGGSCPEVEQCQFQCENTHNLCYSNCGGQVHQQTICVANCNAR